MELQNILIIFAEKIKMTQHELTTAQIAALQKLDEEPNKFYQAHIPVSTTNIYVAQTGKSLRRLSIAIAIDVYTSGIGRARMRYCYDCLRQLNKRSLLCENLEAYIRQLNEKVEYNLAILCNKII